MRATIVYYSSRGRTASYAREIAMYLWSLGLDVNLTSTSDCDMDKLAESDFVLLGCWTSGFFVIGQHPNRHWRAFATKLPKPIRGKLLLFTTYRLRTGSMFSQMKKALGLPSSTLMPTLSSKTGQLTYEERELLKSFVGGKQSPQAH